MSEPYWCCYETMIRLDAEWFECPDCGNVESEAAMIAAEQGTVEWTCSHGYTMSVPNGKRGPKGAR